LATVPPDEFTGRRNALATALEKAGEKQAAVRLKALRKPSVPVWAVNRVAREEPDRIEQLIDAVDRTKAAQLGRGGDLPAIVRQQRATLASLLKRALEFLKKAGLDVSPQTRMRVEKTLMGAAADPGEREALRAGRVERELVPAGFEVFGDAMPRLVPR